MQITDKVITINGVYEIRSISPKLLGYNIFVGNIETIEECLPISNQQYDLLTKMTKEEVLAKINKEYPELRI